MCGIAGFFGNPTSAAADAALTEAMLDAIAHRGPDGRGVRLGGDAALGHVRLAIVDPAGGAQPLADETGQVTITFNGEIFNYLELRAELEARGARFRTRSDTEVLLRLYLDRGAACIEALNGDFAFAIHDRRSNTLLAARDRMGVRPLCWTRRNGRLYFASEVKALLAVPEIAAEPDPLALADMLTLWLPLAPRTAFKDIFELPPAHLLLATPGRVEVRRWWDLDFPTAEADLADRRSEADVAEELAALMADATAIRLRADVPVGAYLSGGLDSAIAASLAAEAAPGRLRTFSVTFDDPELDESAYQEVMVEALGTAHAATRCRAADIGACFAEAIRHVERPILRTAPAPLLRLSRLVRDSGFKVVLTGEGADEVFAGYDIFKEAKLRRFCARQPASRRRPQLYQRLYPYLAAMKAQSPAYRQAFFGMGLDRADDPLFSHLPRFATTAKIMGFLSDELRGAIGGYDPLAALRETLPEAFAGWHPLAQAQYLETVHLLPGYILSAQGDRVAMAHAVEGRFPFLDPRVVDFAARLPARLKLKGLREKHILRESLGGRVPALVADRPKQPYRAPDSVCFFGPDAPAYAAEALSPRAVAETGLFDPGAVAKLARKCARGGALGFKDNMALVGILSAQLWSEAFLGRRGAAGAGAGARQAA